jgi:hypothetical protein
MMAAIGKQLKQSVNVFHSLMLYLRLPKEQFRNEYTLVWSEDGGLTFVVKAVYPIDTRTLVVSSQNKEVFGVFDLVCKEEADRLK